MIGIARLDRRDGKDDEDVDGAELAIDHRAVADIGAGPEIALDQRRQGFESGAARDGLRGHHVHIDAQMLMRPHAPFLGRERGVVEEAQGLGMHGRIGALEARAADHDVDAMLVHIGPDALPEKLDGAPVAIRLEHAGAAELHEAAIL